MAHQAPLKVLDEAGLASGGRRFRFVPLRHRLRATTARPAALPPLPPPSSARADDTSLSHLRDALARRRELDLTADFCAYAAAVEPLATSLPLVVHARARLVARTLEALATPGTPAVPALADCLHALARDLGPELFAPFLPDVAQAIAALLRSGGNDTRTNTAGADAQLWDPSRALEPALAALARIVKILLQPLLHDPREALRALAPVIAHEHYRVRELAAEASAGYLLRKTRDPGALGKLVDACVQFPIEASVPETMERAPAALELDMWKSYAVHGTTAVLYEGTRGVRGALHPRAAAIVGRALSKVMPLEPSDARLVAVFNAIAALCHYCSRSDDASVLFGVILSQADAVLPCDNLESTARAESRGDRHALANVCYLLRRWCMHKQGVTHLTSAQAQRALDFAVTAVSDAGSSASRLTCESLGVITAVLEAANSTSAAARYRAMNKSAREALVCAARSVSADMAPMALQALRTAFDARAVSLAEILPTYATLCNRIAGRPEFAPLDHALLLLRRANATAESASHGLLLPHLVDFYAPDVGRLVAEELSAMPLCPASEEKTEACGYGRALLALEYCRLACASDDACEALSRILEAPTHCVSSAVRAAALDAVVAQYVANIERPGIPEVFRNVCRNARMMLQSNGGELGVVRAGCSLLLTDSVRPERGKMALDFEPDRERILESVCLNFASGNVWLRAYTALLLVNLMPAGRSHHSGHMAAYPPEGSTAARICVMECEMKCTTDEEDDVAARTVANSDEHDTDDDEAEDETALLRRVESGVDFRAVYELLVKIQLMPLTMDNASRIQKFVSLLANLVRRRAVVCGPLSMRRVLANVCIGLFRTRLKLLWSSAGDLWRSLAQEDAEVAWSPLRYFLVYTKDEILMEFGRSVIEAERSPDCNNDSDDGGTDDRPEEDDGICISEAAEQKFDGSAAMRDGTVQVPSVGSKRRSLSESLFGEDARCAQPDSDFAQEVDASNMSSFDEDCRRNQKRLRRGDNSALSMQWNPMEWQVAMLSTAVSRAVSEAAGCAIGKDLKNDSTDAKTLHLQLVGALHVQPELSMSQRTFLVEELYLKLDPDKLSRRVGTSIARSYTNLLQILGGLKCAGDDKGTEDRMRARLLADLCRPDSALQEAVIKCMCVARARELKPHRDSLLRIANDSTFRDELAVLTSRFRDSALRQDTHEDGGVQDVLVRLCFGKMRGRRDKIAARRGAALSFIVTSLSWADAIPRLIRLSLGPLDCIVSESLAENSGTLMALDEAVLSRLPPLNVLRGVLTSIESIVRQFGKAIPDSSWERLLVAVLLILMGTSTMSAKAVRTMAYRSLGTMVDRRPIQSESAAVFAIKNIRKGRFDISSAIDVSDAPGLLVFLSACSRTPLQNVRSVLVFDEKPLLNWCFGIIEADRAQPRAVELALDVASIVCGLRIVNEATGPIPTVDDTADGLVLGLSLALRTRLRHLRDMLTREDGRIGAWKSVLSKTMNVTSYVSACVRGTEDAEALVEALVEFSSPEIRKRSDCLRPTLAALAALFRLVLKEGPSSQGSRGAADRNRLVSKHAGGLAELFSDSLIAKSSTDRECLCDLFESFRRADLVISSKGLRLLGSMRNDRLDEPDLEARALGLSALCAALKTAISAKSDVVLSRTVFGPKTAETSGASSSCDDDVSIALGEEALIAFVHACVAVVTDTDSASRGMAGYVLSLCAEWSMLSNSGRTFYHNIFEVLRSRTVSVLDVSSRREFARALGVLVRLSPASSGEDAPPLMIGLRLLSRNDDLDADFFENVAHLQPHRRSRALRRLSTILDYASKDKFFSGTQSTDTPDVADIVLDGVEMKEWQVLSSEFALPLSYRICLDVSEDSLCSTRRHLKATEARNAARSDVYKWAAATCGSAARLLTAPEYRKLLGRMLHRLPREENELRLQSIYTTVVAVANSCPELARDEIENEAMMTFLANVALPSMMKLISDGVREGDVLSNIVSEHSKHDRVGAGSVKGKSVVFRAPLAVAAANLMGRLPVDQMEQLLPLIVTPVATALRSRMSDVREGAKKALVQMVLLFGSHYLVYIVEQVLSVLSQGFRKDAGVYVLHSLLQGIRASKSKANETVKTLVPRGVSVDLAAGPIAEALCAELVDGTYSDKKDFVDPNVSGSRARDADRRAARATDAMEILGQLISFKEAASRILKPFQEALLKASSSKLVSRLCLALQRMSDGLMRNTSLTPVDGLVFAYELIHDYMPVLTESSGPDVLKENASRPYSSLPQSHRVAEFGFHFLNSMFSKSILKSEGTHDNAKDTLSMLEPFLQEASIALTSRFESLTLVSLKAIQRLIRLPLQSRAVVAKEMTTTVLHVLSSNGPSGGIGSTGQSATSKQAQKADLYQACLRAAAVIIQEVGHRRDGSSMSDDVIRGIVAVARESLTDSSIDIRNAALVLLRNVVNSKFVAPEVYDAVDDITKLAIRAQSAHLQANCIGISVAFLIYYPLSSKRIRQQLEFFIRNLNYIHPDGRRAATHAIRTVMEKFPVSFVEAECGFLFLPLAAVVGNDDDGACRESALDALKCLFAKVSDGRKVTDMLRICFSLLGVGTDQPDPLSLSSLSPRGSTVQQTNAAARRGGAAALAAAARSGVLSQKQLRTSLRTLLLVGMEGSAPTSETDWDVVHTALSSAEAVFEAYANLANNDSDWPCDEASTKLETLHALRTFWDCVPDLLQHEHCWIRVVVCRLLGRHFSALDGRIRLEHISGVEPSHEGAYSLFDGCKGDVRRLAKALCLVLEGAALPDSLAEQVTKNLLFIGDAMARYPTVGEAADGRGAESDEDRHDLKDGEYVKGEQNRGLFWLLRRMSGMATRVGTGESSAMRRACAMRFLAAAVANWDSQHVTPYLHLFVAPVLRVTKSSNPLSGNTAAPDSADSALFAMAMTVQEVTIKSLGADMYYGMYNEQWTRLRQERINRKRKHAVEIAVDPERAAKRRQKRSAAKSDARRKNAASKLESHGSRRISKSSLGAVSGGRRPGFSED